MYVSPIAPIYKKIHAEVDTSVYTYSDNGSYYVNGSESSFDLFMKVETVIKYIAYNKKTGSIVPYCIEEGSDLFIYCSSHSEYQIIEFDAEI